MKAGILIGHLKHKSNEGSLIRTAEAFGMNLVFVLGKKEKIYLASQGTDRHMHYIEFDNIDEFINFARNNKHSIVCVENINAAKELGEIKNYPANPIFIIGNEQTGVPEKLIQNANLVVKIAQGMSYTPCLNATIACAIVIHDFFKKEIQRKNRLWEYHNLRDKNEKNKTK